MLAPIDLIVRIKNSYLAGREELTVPASKIRAAILEQLVAEGYIASFEKVTVADKPQLRVVLRYNHARPALTNIRIMSKPGQKVYVKATEIPNVLNGLGIALLSTTKGIMSGRLAKKAGLGGELLFSIW